MKHSENKHYCPLIDGECDNKCEFWDDCPYEEHDISDQKFMSRVVDIAKKKYQN